MKNVNNARHGYRRLESLVTYNRDRQNAQAVELLDIARWMLRGAPPIRGHAALKCAIRSCKIPPRLSYLVSMPPLGVEVVDHSYDSVNLTNILNNCARREDDVARPCRDKRDKVCRRSQMGETDVSGGQGLPLPSHVGFIRCYLFSK